MKEQDNKNYPVMEGKVTENKEEELELDEDDSWFFTLLTLGGGAVLIICGGLVMFSPKPIAIPFGIGVIALGVVAICCSPIWEPGRKRRRKEREVELLALLKSDQLKTLREILAYTEEDEEKKAEAEKNWVHYKAERLNWPYENDGVEYLGDSNKFQEIVFKKLSMEDFFLEQPSLGEIAGDVEEEFKEEYGFGYKRINDKTLREEMELFVKYYCFRRDYFEAVINAERRAWEERAGKVAEEKEKPEKPDLPKPPAKKKSQSMEERASEYQRKRSNVDKLFTDKIAKAKAKIDEQVKSGILPPEDGEAKKDKEASHWYKKQDEALKRLSKKYNF